MQRVFKTVKFEVTADKIRGQGRPRFAIRGGSPSTYKDEADKAWEELIRNSYLAQGGSDMSRFADAVRVTVRVKRKAPKSMAKKRESQPDICRPDLDNIIKSVLDALNGVAWRDDCQVVGLRGDKMDRTRRTDESLEVTVEYLSEMGERWI